MKEQLTLGQFIFLLSRVEPTATVRYDFGSFVPKGIDSYRGYYNQLAIGSASYEEVREVRAAILLALCRDAVGKTFTGYKGGDYDMGEPTPLWVANNGECHGTAIVGLRDLEYMAVIETAYLE